MASTERPLVADEHDKPETTTSLTQHGSTENDQAKPEPGYQSGLPFFLVVFALLLSMFLVSGLDFRDTTCKLTNYTLDRP